MQETPELMPEGETPLSVHIVCFDELVDSIKPGDKVEVVGVMKAQSLRVNPRMRTLKTVYRTYIEAISFTKIGNQQFAMGEEDKHIITPKMKYDIQKLKSNPDKYKILVESFAPSIFENDDVKKGLLLQLFGGVNKDFSKIGRGRFRGEVNTLLIGDPSTAKSQLLQFVHNLAPRGIYTSGKADK
jgi:DNA replication licensing factor MCM4